MSASFTTAASNHWPTLLREISTAYSERRLAAGFPTYTPQVNRNVQSAAWWAGIQEWLDEAWPFFVNHVDGPFDEYTQNFLMYQDVESWRVAAGLDVRGWRRQPEGQGATFGRMEIRDAIGPWIFEDIQRAFSSLLWTQTQIVMMGPNSDGHFECIQEPGPETLYTPPVDQEISLWGGIADDDFTIDGVNPLAGRYVSTAGDTDARCNSAHDIAERDFFLKNAVAGVPVSFRPLDNYGGNCFATVILLFRNQFTNA